MKLFFVELKKVFFEILFVVQFDVLFLYLLLIEYFLSKILTLNKVMKNKLKTIRRKMISIEIMSFVSLNNFFLTIFL
jgi:hypothetical protein